MCRPEQGLTLPGLLVVCGDSHTSTHGALGAYAFGIGASEVAHVLMTQTIWQKKPPRMRITVDAVPRRASPPRTSCSRSSRMWAPMARQDTPLNSPALRSGNCRRRRLTSAICLIEAGAHAAWLPTRRDNFAYLKGRPYAPKGAAFDKPVAEWSSLTTDAERKFDKEVTLDAKTSRRS